MNIRTVYLDNAATTAVYPDVAEVMADAIKNIYGNPSALYHFGDMAKTEVDTARESIAATLNCSPDEIYFTSGGSESDNWAIKGIAEAYKDKGNHIITTSIEHKAVLRSCKWLEERGYEVTYVEPNNQGVIHPNDIFSQMRPDTILVSVMMANNEIGTIEPIEMIGKMCEDKGIIFHTDAVQAYGHLKLDVEQLHVSLLSASGHKFHGPKGVGFLYVKDGVRLPSFIHGGGQENGLRAGTENVPGIIGMGLAAKLSDEKLSHGSDVAMSAVRDYFIDRITEEIPVATLNGSPHKRLPNNISFTFQGLAAASAV